MAHRVVYSTDPKDNKICPVCKKLERECKCRPQEDANSKFVAYIRLEKGGRAGKTVTVIERLPKNEKFLKTLSQELKSRCGTGGTFYIHEDKGGVVELQGDKKAQVQKFFDAKGIKQKFV